MELCHVHIDGRFRKTYRCPTSTPSLYFLAREVNPIVSYGDLPFIEQVGIVFTDPQSYAGVLWIRKEIIFIFFFLKKNLEASASSCFCPDVNICYSGLSKTFSRVYVKAEIHTVIVVSHHVGATCLFRYEVTFPCKRRVLVEPRTIQCLSTYKIWRRWANS